LRRCTTTRSNAAAAQGAERACGSLGAEARSGAGPAWLMFAGGGVGMCWEVAVDGGQRKSTPTPKIGHDAAARGVVSLATPRVLFLRDASRANGHPWRVRLCSLLRLVLLPHHCLMWGKHHVIFARWGLGRVTHEVASGVAPLPRQAHICSSSRRPGAGPRGRAAVVGNQRDLKHAQGAAAESMHHARDV